MNNGSCATMNSFPCVHEALLSRGKRLCSIRKSECYFGARCALGIDSLSIPSRFALNHE